MAKILYEVKQNQNEHNAAFGKWYAQIKSLETLNTRRLAQHISEHGSIYTPDVVYGVLEKFRSCLVEMLLESKKVKIEGLGTFYCTLENQKNGALKKEDFNVNKHLKALHIRFLPEQTTEENISSREFLKKAEFINIDSLTKSDENGGLTPDPSPTGEGSDNQDGSGSQNSGSGSSNTNDTNSVAAPVISGTSPFEESTQVSISGPEGASIYYSVNGDDPDTNDTLYSQPFTVDETTTVKAIAIKDGVSSSVASKTLYKSSSGDDNSGGFEMGS